MDTKTNELTSLRAEIDQLDADLIALLARRFVVTRKVGQYKKDNQLNSVDHGRLNQMLDRATLAANEQSINPELVKSILLLVHEYVVEEHLEIAQNPAK